jgi:hypothetical protein
MLSAFAMNFFAKNGTFFGGSTPAVVLYEDLVFGEKAELPFDFIESKIYICTIDWGVGYAKDLEIL